MTSKQDQDKGQSIRDELRSLRVLAGPFQDPRFDLFPATPQEAYIKWLHEAIAADVKEPHAMTLATVDADGIPDARVLIVKNVDDRGWHFAVKGGSPKGQHLANNSGAALVFYWPEQGRQIRVRGQAVQLSSEECQRDLNERPLSSKISALGSHQSHVLGSPQELSDSMEIARQVLERKDEVVDSLIDWKVYAVKPTHVEFWQGASSRLHQRLRYTSSGAAWEMEYLWP